jgi:hypothetical protein
VTVYKFLDGVTADTTSRTFDIDVEKNPYLLVQISITNAATVNIQGRLSGMTDDDYKTLNADAYTADDLIEVRACPNMRVVATGVNGALKVYGEGFRSHVLT